MKSCPFCEGQLMDTVVRCVHCGKDLNTPESEAAAAGKAAAAGEPGAPVNPLAAAAALGVAGGPPSINALPAPTPVEDLDFSDQPQYFAMKTEVTPEGARPSVATTLGKDRAGGGSGSDAEGRASLAAGLALVAAVMVLAGLLAFPALTVHLPAGTANIPPRFGGGTFPFPETTTSETAWSGFWGNYILAIASVITAVTAFGFFSKREAKVMGALLGQGIVLVVMSALLWSSLGSAVDTAGTTVRDGMIEGMRSEAPELTTDEAGAIADQILPSLAISKGMGVWIIFAGSGLALIGGIIGATAASSLKKKSTSSVSPPPPPAGR